MIEWPSRLGTKRPQHWLEIDIRIAPAQEEADQLATPSTSETNENVVGEEDDVSDFLRCVDLTPRGQHWEDRLRALVADGVLDDLILADNDDLSK